MTAKPSDVLLSFWSGALGVSPNKIVDGTTSFSSVGIYRQRQEGASFLFEHFASNSVVVSAPPEDIAELKLAASTSFSELENFLANKFSLEFDDFDFSLPRKQRSFAVSHPYRVDQMNPNYKTQLDSFLKSCTEDDVDTLDLSDDTLDEHVVVGLCGEKIVGVGRYFVIPGTEVLADLTLLTGIDHRGKGLAKTILTNLINELLSLNLVPRYRVRTTGFSSIKVAESLGFEKFNRIRSYFPKAID